MSTVSRALEQPQHGSNSVHGIVTLPGCLLAKVKLIELGSCSRAAAVGNRARTAADSILSAFRWSTKPTMHAGAEVAAPQGPGVAVSIFADR